MAAGRSFRTLGPNTIAPIYPINIVQLQLAWQNMLAQQARIKLTYSSPEEHHYQYVQYSKVFRFPDYIDVQFIPLSNNQSTLAIYSRARFGNYDFHVNEKRIKNWLAILSHNFKP